MTTRAWAAFSVAGLVLVSATGALGARAAGASAFQQPRAAVKSAIAAQFGCSWRPYLGTAEQCGDELVVLSQGEDGAVESVEINCRLDRSMGASASCRHQALWLMDAFLPSWAGRGRWVAKLLQAPPRKGKWLETTVGKATVLAQAEGPADVDVDNLVIGVTRGDPGSWDLPH